MRRDEGRVKRFLGFGGGLWLKDTTGDRVGSIPDPYETGDPEADMIKPIENVRAVRGGYSEDAAGELGAS